MQYEYSRGWAYFYFAGGRYRIPANAVRAQMLVLPNGHVIEKGYDNYRRNRYLSFHLSLSPASKASYLRCPLAAAA